MPSLIQRSIGRAARNAARGGVALAAVVSGGSLLGCAWLALIPTSTAYAAAETPKSSISYDARYMEAQLLTTAGKPADAARLLEPLTQNADCPDFIFTSLAQAWLSSTESDKALQVADLGIKRFPNSVDLLVLHASIQREKGRIAEAIADLQAAQKISPNRKGILEMLSELHLSRLISNPADSDREVKELISVYNQMLTIKKGNDRLVPLMVLSTLYLKAGQPDKALEAAAEAQKIRPDSPRIQEAYASALIAAGKLDEAIEVYRKSLALAPDDEEVRHKVEALLIKQGGEARRIRFYVELANDNKENPAVLQLAAQSLIGAKRWPEAETALRNLLVQKPDDVPNKLALVHVWVEMGRVGEALTEAKKLGDKSGDLAPAIALSVAESFESSGHRPEAMQLLQEYNSNHPLNENVALGLVSLLIEDKQQEKALSVLEKIRKESPDSFLATTLMAQVYADDNRFAEAHRVLASLPPPVKEKHTVAVDLLRGGLYVNEGVQLEQKKEYDKAQKLYQQANEVLDAIPAPADAGDRQRMLDLRVNIWLNRGQVLQQQGNLKEAEAAYKKGIELDPKNAEAYNTLGYFYAETSQKLEEGRELIGKALELKPGAAHIIDSLGWLYFKQQKFDDAVKQLQLAVKGMPEDPDAGEVFDHLGDALNATGKTDDARKAWQKAIDLKPNDLDVEAVKKKIAR